jgi:group I intron endonuclease
MNKIHYVYLTTNLINGKQYVGDHTINIKEKKYYIGSGDIFLKACKKYNEENFFKEILEWFETREEAFNAQEKYIKQFNTLKPNGYNISPKGGHQCKNSVSEETKRKISISNRSKAKTDKARQNMSLSKIGKPSNSLNKIWSKESRDKLKNSKIGIKHTEDHNEKISNGLKGKNLGKIRSKEFKENLSKIKKGIPSNVKGKKWNEESRKKLSNSLKNKISNRKGKIHSEKTKQKMRESSINRKRKICLYCNKEISINLFNRWHNKNCKLYKN